MESRVIPAHTARHWLEVKNDRRRLLQIRYPRSIAKAGLGRPRLSLVLSIRTEYNEVYAVLHTNTDTLLAPKLQSLVDLYIRTSIGTRIIQIDSDVDEAPKRLRVRFGAQQSPMPRCQDHQDASRHADWLDIQNKRGSVHTMKSAEGIYL